MDKVNHAIVLEGNIYCPECSEYFGKFVPKTFADISFCSKCGSLFLLADQPTNVYIFTNQTEPRTTIG